MPKLVRGAFNKLTLQKDVLRRVSLNELQPAVRDVIRVGLGLGPRIGGAVIGVLWPNTSIGKDVFTPAEIWERAGIRTTGRPPDKLEEFPVLMPGRQRYIPPDAGDSETARERGQRALRNLIERRLGLPETVPDVGPPSPSRVEQDPYRRVELGMPGSPPTVSQPPPPKPPAAKQSILKKGPLGRLNQATLNKAMLYSGIAELVLQKRKSRGSTSTTRETQPTGGNVAVDVATPGSQPTLGTTPLTAFNIGSVGSGGACHCGTKKRGKARKCLERGTVAWKSGRYKGRAAGTKCIRYAT